MSEEQLSSVKGHYFEALYEKLIAFSISLAKLYFKKNFKNLPKGYTYEDVVQYALNLAIDREWEDFSLERFEGYLFGAIKSKYWALAISADNKRTEPLMHEYDDGTEVEKINGSTRVLEEADEIVDSLIYSETLELVESEINKNESRQELTLVFNCIREGLETRQIVERTSLPTNMVTNYKRTLLRIVDKISKTINNA